MKPPKRKPARTRRETHPAVPAPVPAATTRRFGLLAGAAAVVAIAGVAAWMLWAPRAPGGGPIVLISIDTLRADRLPAYGYTGTNTPHIDRLVGDGIVFERAYTHSPQTLPAHTSLFTGELPFEHGVRDNVGFSIRDDQRMLQHTLREHGYTTGGFVSAYVLREQTGIARGFDHYDDELPAATPDLPLGQVQRPGEETVAAATRWIDGLAAPKFFLFLHIYEPHRPYTPPPSYAGKPPYDGEVEYSDAIVGRLLDHLRQKGLYEDATIVLLSDHGEGLGDHGEDEHGMFLYRETIQVPLILKLPGGRHAGRRVADPVQHVDLPPTLLDLADIEGRDPGRGRSLRPALDGDRLPEADIYAETLSPRYHFGWSELYALGGERYRFIRAPRDELFDIVQDPNELRSIAAERPQVRDAMRRALERLIADAELSSPSAVSDADREKLAALGYVGTQTGASLRTPGDELPDPKDKIEVLRKYKRATDLAGERRFAEAADAMREILSTDPQMSDVWIQLAGMYERLGRTADAVAAYKEGVRSNPRSASALTGAAAGLLELGRLDEARAHAELAVDVAPAAAHELLARVALEKQDYATARAEARTARDVDPTLPAPALVEGLILHRQGRFADALPHFLEARKAAAARTVQIPELNYYIGDCLGRLERYAEAEPYFAAELSLFPRNLRARAGLAMLYRATGRDGEAERAIETMTRLSPTPNAYEMAAQLWTMFGEPRRATVARQAAARARK